MSFVRCCIINARDLNIDSRSSGSLSAPVEAMTTTEGKVFRL